MSDRLETLVLGLGNVLCSDDGAGVAAVHRLRRCYELPTTVRVVDGGTLGLDLLGLIAASDRVILVDAVHGDEPAGTLVRLAGADVAPAIYERLSPHQVGVADLLAGAALCDRYPSEVVIVGIVPQSTTLQLGCTPVVAAQLDALVEHVVAELRRLGIEPERRHEPMPAHDDGARALGL